MTPNHILLVSILFLLIGPLLFTLAKPRVSILEFLDGFILIAISEMVLFHILPETYHHIGFLAIVLVFLGLVLPSTLEKLKSKISKKAHSLTLVLGILGVFIHSLTDGISLSSHFVSHSQLHSLSFAVLLHRLPVGLTIWWLIRPSYGFLLASLALAGIAITTVLGYYSSDFFIQFLQSETLSYFAAFMGGSLLHVIFHKTNPHKHKTKIKWASGVGAIFAFCMIVIMQDFISHSHDHDSLISSHLFFNLFLESAPALLIAYIGASLIQTFLPTQSILWMKKGKEFSQALKGMIFGLPIPVCSCGVLPVYRSLVKQGIPLSSGIAFFVATPELGLDALLISLPLLGVKMTLARLICAAIIALLVGFLIGKFFKNQFQEKTELVTQKKSQKNIKTILHNLHEVIDHTGPWILLGIGLAVIFEPFIKNSFLTSLPIWLEIPLFSLLGIPVYVCASGATPLVAILIAGGVSPAAGIAFLLTGPATNIATFGILKLLYNQKLAITFGVLMISLSIGLSFLTHVFLPKIQLAHSDHAHSYYSYSLQIACLILLTGLFLLSLLRKGPRHWINQILSFEHNHDHDHHHHAKKSENPSTKIDSESSCCH